MRREACDSFPPTLSASQPNKSIPLSECFSNTLYMCGRCAPKCPTQCGAGHRSPLQGVHAILFLQQHQYNIDNKSVLGQHECDAPEHVSEPTRRRNPKRSQHRSRALSRTRSIWVVLVRRHPHPHCSPERCSRSQLWCVCCQGRSWNSNKASRTARGEQQHPRRPPSIDHASKKKKQKTKTKECEEFVDTRDNCV